MLSLRMKCGIKNGRMYFFLGLVWCFRPAGNRDFGGRGAGDEASPMESKCGEQDDIEHQCDHCEVYRERNPATVADEECRDDDAARNGRQTGQDDVASGEEER